MNKSGLISILSLCLIVVFSSISMAQFRDEEPTDFTGSVIEKNDRKSSIGNWANFLNMQMSHSYSMSFTSFGGQFQNINAYTNSMDFYFSDRFTGELDISLLHSPFGNSFINNQSGNGLGTRVIIRNAELNYQIGERSSITIQFQQHPFYGVSPYSPYRRTPFDF